MVAQSTLSDHCVSPTQVWPALPADCKTRIVWLLAQLAFNRVIAHAESNSQEVHYAARSARSHENPA